MGNSNDEYSSEDNFSSEETTTDDSTIHPWNGIYKSGWRWVILFSAFIINLIIDGCSFTFGVLLTELLEYFHTTRSDTAWIGSVFCAVPLLCGPIASVISKKIGIRKATILGGVIAAIGFVSASCTNSVMALCVTYGVIGGFGVSLPYLNSVVMVAVYFRTNRALATGIAECGAGIGTLIFAPFLEICINEYGWRGAILIFGGIVSNIIVCGATFRLHFNDLETEVSLSTFDEKSTNIDENNVSASIENLSIYNYCKTFTRLNSVSSENIKEYVVENNIIKKVPAVQDLDSQIFREITFPKNYNHRLANSCPELRCHDDIEPRTKEIFTSYRNNKSINFVDLSVLRNPTFLAYACANFIIYFWNDTPYIFIVDRAISLNVRKTNASFLVSIIGILHTLGNIIFGYAADKSSVNKSLMYCVNNILCGICLVVIPHFTTYLPIAVLAGLFGLFSAVMEAMACVIIVEILGLCKLTDAYSINMFLQGIATLLGPPFAGFLYDSSGSYTNTFVAAGSCIMAAGLMYCSVNLIGRTKPFENYTCI